jgi:hypothetical protein
MDTLNPASLDWALTHIRRYGDTDIFPVPFEFEAIAHCWPSLIRPALEQIDLANYMPSSSRRLLFTKPGGGFRVAVQLDPLDAIIYTALVYEAADAIERSRVDASQRVACAYRVALDANGSFFPSESGWDDFHQRSSELSTGGYTHVLLADIADFYNQVYLHRVESALDIASVPRERAGHIHEFLLSLNVRQSRGLPVGPVASILLAEAALTDVDTFLLRKGAVHTRYVDDFRIFCNSRREALAIQHDLTDYLYTSHRLSLESYKTRVVHIRKFMKEELRDPADEERKAKTSKLHQLIDDLREMTGYHITPDELPDDEKATAVRESISELFRSCVETRPLHLGLARHLLRRAYQMRTAVILNLVLQNLEVLAPVFRDVSRYLIKSAPKRSAAASGAQLPAFLSSSDIGTLPFLRAWVLEIFRQRPEMATQEETLRLARESEDTLGLRYTALGAHTFRQLDWVRAHKENWRNHGSWDRRAVIWSSCVLPLSERRPWLDVVAGSGDTIDKAVAGFAASQP